MPQVKAFEKSFDTAFDKQILLRDASKEALEDAGEFLTWARDDDPRLDMLQLYYWQKAMVPFASAKAEVKRLSFEKGAVEEKFKDAARSLHTDQDRARDHRQWAERRFSNKYRHLKRLMDQQVKGTPEGYWGWSDEQFQALASKVMAEQQEGKLAGKKRTGQSGQEASGRQVRQNGAGPSTSSKEAPGPSL